MRLSFVLAAALLWPSLAGPAAAQGYAEAERGCLHLPINYEAVAKNCTIIIESGRLNPLDRAYALNNRARGLGRSEAQNDRDLDEAIRLAPHLAMLYRWRSFRWRRQPARAVADLNEAIRLDPLFAVAYEERGEAHVELKQYERAIDDFSEAIRLAPTYLHPMYNPYEQRARAKEAIGNVRGAAADRALVIALWPGNRPEYAATSDIFGSREPNVGGIRSWEGWLTK